MRYAAPFAKLGVLAAAALCIATAGCPNGSGPAGSPQWPAASKIKPEPLSGTSEWPGVYFINTAGSRGYMHLLSSGSDGNIHGCWLAEDRHARATFTGTVQDNLAKFDWTENKVGFAGPPSHLTAYLVMTPQADGRDKVAGKYGEDLSDDGVNEWQGVKQKGQQPKEDGCKLDEGDTIQTEGKGLQ